MNVGAYGRRSRQSACHERIREVAMPSHLRDLVNEPIEKGEGPREFLFWVVKRNFAYSYYNAVSGVWEKTRREGTMFRSAFAARLIRDALRLNPRTKDHRFVVAAVYLRCMHCKKKLAHVCGGKKRFW